MLCKEKWVCRFDKPHACVYQLAAHECLTKQQVEGESDIRYRQYKQRDQYKFVQRAKTYDQDVANISYFQRS